VIELVEAYAKEQGLWHDEHSEQPTFSDTVSSTFRCCPSIAGPKRPQTNFADRRQGVLPRALAGYLPDEDEEDEAIADSFRQRPGRPCANGAATSRRGDDGRAKAAQLAHGRPVTLADGTETELEHGTCDRGITSCTNTSNPASCSERASWPAMPYAGAHGQAVGEDLAGPGSKGHRVPEASGADRVPTSSRSTCRLRCTTCIPQQRPAARRSPRS